MRSAGLWLGLPIAGLLGLVAVPVQAETVLAWLDCEAQSGGATILAGTTVFPVESDTLTIERAIEGADGPEDMAGQLWEVLRSGEAFQNAIVEEYGDAFQARLRDEGGWVCVSEVRAGGPHETMEEAELQRGIVAEVLQGMRKEFDGIDLEIREFSFP
jgi:hypothetical protein